MERRDAIKNILLFGVAPAFVVNGLMRIKPIVVPLEETFTEEMAVEIMTSFMNSDGYQNLVKEYLQSAMWYGTEPQIIATQTMDKFPFKVIPSVDFLKEL